MTTAASRLGFALVAILAILAFMATRHPASLPVHSGGDSVGNAAAGGAGTTTDHSVQTAYGSIVGNPCPPGKGYDPKKQIQWPFSFGTKLRCSEWKHILDGHPSFNDTADKIRQCLRKTLALGTRSNATTGNAKYVYKWTWGKEAGQVSKVWVDAGGWIITAVNSAGEKLWTACGDAMP